MQITSVVMAAWFTIMPISWAEKRCSACSHATAYRDRYAFADGMKSVARVWRSCPGAMPISWPSCMNTAARKRFEPGPRTRAGRSRGAVGGEWAQCPPTIHQYDRLGGPETWTAIVLLLRALPEATKHCCYSSSDSAASANHALIFCSRCAHRARRSSSAGDAPPREAIRAAG